MNGGATYRRGERSLSRTYDGEILLGSPDREGIDRLEGTAAAVWIALAEPATVADIADALAEAYDAPADVIARDVDGLLRDLRVRGWVTEVPGVAD